MNRLKGNDKTLMSGETLDALMNIAINGPEVNALDVEAYTKEYARNNPLCDPVIASKKHKIDDHYKNPNQASKRSKIFTN